jgi:hypothetical protein
VYSHLLAAAQHLLNANPEAKPNDIVAKVRALTYCLKGRRRMISSPRGVFQVYLGNYSTATQIRSAVPAASKASTSPR